ncbi:hypothetical protein F511_33280 [Dorcoceras hygrometricum]|uniref:CCHC-type domain-containing protein n=1 Tax=Dorcoceras hygrometricum TaxID=472368 RepID=A0A2Z7CUZ1_9LAMI|nr:hypothetical protein F511_33280 [Dorcoceras hygrometricum]
MSLFVKKFGKYLRRSFNPATTSFNNYSKSDKVSNDLKCYNCDRPGHFAADCNRPKKDDRYKREDRRADDRYRKEERYRRDDDEDERTVEKSKDKSKDKFKERSSDRKMKSSNNKRFSRKHDRKVLVAEESTKSWADSDSDTSSSSSSSSDSEQEEVHCLMANQTDEDEVFDFSNVEFTRDDLVIALNDMVKEYRKLSHSFEEAKAENNSLKISSAESSSDEQEDADTLKTELSKLKAENEMLRNEISELKAEVAKSTVEMSSYSKSTITLQKICENQKQASDKTGIGFSDSEFCKGESSTQSRPAYDKFNKRSFVKADMIYDCFSTLLDFHRHYLMSGQPWTATASQTFDLLSAVHSESLDALCNQQQEHGIFLEQPCSSTAVDYAEDCSAVFARFFSVARSTCWVRPLICVDGIWMPLQGPDFWRSGSKLSLFLNKVEMSVPAVQDIFGHSVSFIEPTQYWEAAPFLHKTWAWHCVCTEVFPFTLSGRLRPANRSTDIVMYSFDVQKLPAYLLDDFQRGLHTDCFASYFGSSDDLSDSKTHSDSSSGCTVYRSPSPGESGSSSRPPPVRVERRPLPIPPSPRDAAGSSGAVRIPTLPRPTGAFEERVEQARRHLFESGLIISVEEAAERIRQADIQESDRLQRERDRARREKRSSSSRRRRGS